MSKVTLGQLLPLHEPFLFRICKCGDVGGGGCHLFLQGNLPNTGIKPESPALVGRFFTTESPGNVTWCHTNSNKGLKRLL